MLCGIFYYGPRMRLPWPFVLGKGGAGYVIFFALFTCLFRWLWDVNLRYAPHFLEGILERLSGSALSYGVKLGVSSLKVRGQTSQSYL